MTKQNLKIVEASLDEELEAALAAEKDAQRRWKKASDKLASDFPEDARLIAERNHWDPVRTDYFNASANVLTLQQSLVDASHHVERIRRRIAESATVEERREDLATALKDAKAATKEVSRLQAAVDRAATALETAEREAADAAAAVEDARVAHLEQFAAAIEQGHPAGRNDAQREAQARETAANDALATARAAAETMGRKLEAAKVTQKEANRPVEAAARFVLAAAAPTLLAEARRIQLELGERRQVLSFLSGCCEGRGEHDAIAEFLSRPVFPKQMNQRSDWPETVPWRDALVALQFDATAVLPGGDGA